ncbi:DUF4260 family protein [Quadrisphaera sp. DSM 44207]|uniref:DUF4260 family protein n=1 Tax=Quadrisphaera sp. DSM 44207 TaxID=1881057 RepID=UPI00088158A3|nr:DUF4260 family protein [Quadrisphaera sp. DSM 44207]SDQ08704.1 protein of unknown function [Quadrisphaera sp. DSM 44207]
MTPAAAVTHGEAAALGLPGLLLRAEGAVLAASALWAFAHSGLPWWVAAALLLVPDLAALALLAGPRAGAVAYDATHTTVLPGVLVLAWSVTGSGVVLGLGAVWLLHIGTDRALGFGLRYPHDPDLTHLGRVGRAGRRAPARG